MRLIIGMSGSSGVIYGIRMLEMLAACDGIETHLILSSAARMNIGIETDWKVEDVEALADVVHNNKNIGASIASGSFKTAGMVVVPCSMKTLSGVANSYADNLIVRAADHVDLDPGCVLYGAIELTPLDMVSFGPFELPRAAAVNGATLLVNLAIVILLFKELRLSSFDPALADTLGFSSGFIHYLLMTMVAVTTVAAFESVGSIIVIAMLIVPAATALLSTRRLIPMLFIAAAVGAASSWIGHFMAIRIPPLFGVSDTTSSGMMAFAAGLLFTLAWIFAPHEGLVAQFLRARGKENRIPESTTQSPLR